MLLGALEAGGTKMVCAIGNETGTILDRITLPTETPAITIPRMIDYFKQFKLEALGIGTFGPADLNPASKTYGSITTTPKLAWANYNIRLAFADALQVPVGFDTDVNAAALGEASFGCMQDIDTGIYITIGTGVGVGVMVNRRLLHGMLHPEGGHILLSRHSSDTYKGSCLYHDNCLEGLAAGPSFEGRYGKKAMELKDFPEVWELEADYIAQALMNYILILSPERIVLGGGVMHQEQLFPLVRKRTAELLNGYIKTKQMDNLDTYIVPPSLDDNQGVLGCLKLALNTLDDLAE
ncbi:MAG: ROK family protein [Lachnospiraceae bacterium]|nr:ROK family protein [Lachnospiraceae bacterium]